MARLFNSRTSAKGEPFEPFLNGPDDDADEPRFSNGNQVIEMLKEVAGRSGANPRMLDAIYNIVVHHGLEAHRRSIAHSENIREGRKRFDPKLASYPSNASDYVKAINPATGEFDIDLLPESKLDELSDDPYAQEDLQAQADQYHETRAYTGRGNVNQITSTDINPELTVVRKNRQNVGAVKACPVCNGDSAVRQYLGADKMTGCRCDDNGNVCAACDNMPMMVGTHCPTCKRKGQVTEDEMARSPKLNIVVPNDISDSIVSTFLNPKKITVPMPAPITSDDEEQFESERETWKKARGFGSKSKEMDTDYDGFLNNLYELSKPRIDSLTTDSFDDPDQLVAEQEIERADPEVLKGVIPKDTKEMVDPDSEEEDEFTAPKAPHVVKDDAVLGRPNHPRSCVCEGTGNLIGSENPRALKRVRDINNNPDYFREIADANSKKNASERQLAIHDTNERWFVCPGEK